MAAPDAPWAAARRYAEAGVPVLPLHYPVSDQRARRLGAACSCRNPRCPAPGKHPLGLLVPRGLKDATCEPERLAAWWAEHPRANIGLATGHVFDALDVDGTAGAAAIRAFARVNPLPGHGPLVKTGSGGWHYYFAPTGLGNPDLRRQGLTSVDWRGRGGYVVAPPSRHGSGGRYSFLRDLTHPIPAVPAALRARLEPAPPQRSATQRAERPGLHGHAYGQRALEAECAQLAAMAPRSGRNNFLFSAGLRLYGLVRGEVLDADQVDDQLLAAATASGLSERESLATLRSARRLAEHNPPRGVPIAPASARRPRPRDTKTRSRPSSASDGADADQPSALASAMARGQPAPSRKEPQQSRADSGHRHQNQHHQQHEHQVPRRRCSAPGPDPGRCPLMSRSDDRAMAVQMEDGTWSAGCASHQRALGSGMDESRAQSVTSAHNLLQHPPARDRREDRDARER